MQFQDQPVAVSEPNGIDAETPSTRMFQSGSWPTSQRAGQGDNRRRAPAHKLTASNIPNRNRTATLTRCSERNLAVANARRSNERPGAKESKPRPTVGAPNRAEPLRSHMGVLRHQRSSILLPCAKNLSFPAIVATRCRPLSCGAWSSRLARRTDLEPACVSSDGNARYCAAFI